MKSAKLILILGLIIPSLSFACKSEYQPVNNKVETVISENSHPRDTNSENEKDSIVSTDKINKEVEEIIKLEKEETASIDAKPSKEQIPSAYEESTDPDMDEDINDNAEKVVSIEEEIQPIEVQEKLPEKEETLFSGAPSHATWDKLLINYVKSGKVNYNGFKNDPQFESYLNLLAENHPESSWSRNEKLAYWINAYNAFTVKLIVNNYPVKSIMDLHGGKSWDVKWINLGKKTYSLNQIEHEIIRPQFKEPRIHFAVNCAATSCPPLASKAFTASNLNSLLDLQTKTFINNDQFNSISSGKVELSKIFEWYAEDFGDLLDYINKYADKKVSGSTKIQYKDYDWALNGF